MVPKNLLLTLLNLMVICSFFRSTGQPSHCGLEFQIPNAISQGQYYTLDQIDDLHFFIKAEGKPYKALGINHFHNMTTKNYDSVIQHIKNLGFTAGGYQGPEWIWDRYPYTKGINLLKTSIYRKGKRFEFEDVFDPSFSEVLDSRIRKVAKPMSKNTNLIGYFWTDLPVWFRKKRGGWIHFFKELDASAPGHLAFLKWKEDNPSADEELFVVEVAKKVYKEGYALLKKYDANHLIFGDRFHQIDMPDTIVQAIIPYVDALAIQPTEDFNKAFYDRLYHKYGKPIYVADHVSSFATKEHPISMGQVAKTESAYAAYYQKTISDYFNLPFIVGFNKCQYQDQVRPDLLKQGIVRTDGTHYGIQKDIMNSNLTAMRIFEKMILDYEKRNR